MNKKLLFLFCSLFLWLGAKAETVPLTSAKFGSNAATATGQTVYATNHTADDALAIFADVPLQDTWHTCGFLPSKSDVAQSV